MKPIKGIIAAVTLAVLATGCASADSTAANRPADKPVTSAPAVTEVPAPSPTTTGSLVTKPAPVLPGSDGAAETVFGPEYFADNEVADLAARWMGVAFANAGVVSGEMTPLDAVLALPFTNEAAAAVKADPTSWTLVSFTDPAAGRVGTGATPLYPERMNVRWEAVKKDGIDQLRVTFTGQVRTTYTEAGAATTLDGERDFELWLVPSTDPEGDKWFINGFRNSEVHFAGPVPAGDQR